MTFLNCFTAAACRRIFSTSVVLSRSIRGHLQGQEVTYPIAGKKPKIVKECREAVSVIKSGEFDTFIADIFSFF